MSGLLIDLRHGVRLLVRSPGFASVAVLTLALGVGANTAVFSVLKEVLIEPLPYREAESLVVPVTTNAARGVLRGSVSYPDYLDWKAATGVFEHVAVFWGLSLEISFGSEAERALGLQVSEDYFDLLRVEPSLGRLFSPEEHAAGGPKVVVLSDGTWRRRFGADAGIVGGTVKLGGAAHTVIGILPAGGIWPASVEAWLPLQLGPTPPAWVMRRDNCIFQTVARLAPGATLEEAQAFQDLMARRVAAENPESKAGEGYGVIPMREWQVQPEARLALLVLFGAVLVVLAIACANLANLMLARGAGRGRELAVRTALGASRTRLVAQLLAESLVLAAAGGAAGFLAGRWGVDLLLAAAPQDSFVTRRAAGGASDLIDASVLAFALALALVAAVAAGLVPALQLSTNRLGEALREGRRAGPDAARSGRTRASLVVAEIALCLVLLVGAGLLIRSLRTLGRVNPGFAPGGLLTLEISLPETRYSHGGAVTAFYARLLEQVRSLPGVAGAATASALPVGGGGFYLGRSFLVEGWPEPPAGADRSAQWNVVSPEFFETMGIGLVKGRVFTPRDDAAAPPVMILNESMARALSAGEDPLGRRVRSWRDENVLREVVGVVRDVRYFGVSDQDRSLVYVPHAQDTWESMLLVVRAGGDPRGPLSAVRRAVRSLDPELAIGDVSTMEEALGRSVAPSRFIGLLLSAFAGVALLLALVGLYGLVSYSVARRTHEFGIRMALGAGRTDVMRLVTGQVLRLALAGAVVGVAAAWAATRLMAGLLYGVAPTDPATFLATPLLLVAATLLACYLPARRATRVDPMAALRSE